MYFLHKTMETKSSTRNYLHFAIKVYACLALDWQARKSRWNFFPPLTSLMPPEKIWRQYFWNQFYLSNSQMCFRVWQVVWRIQLSNVQATLVDLSVIDQEHYMKELGTKDKRPGAILCIVCGLLYKAGNVSCTHQATDPHCFLLLE